MGYSELIEASIKMNGYYANGVHANFRPAAHEILDHYPNLTQADALDELQAALLLPRSGSNYDVFLRSTHTVRLMAETSKVSGLAALAGSELNPAWVTERLNEGDVDSVLTVAGLVQVARNTAKEVHEVQLQVQRSAD